MKIKTQLPNIINYCEIILAIIAVLGVIVFSISEFSPFITVHWSSELFYEFISTILLITIGVEVARSLVTHSIESVLELLAFVVARKALKPDTNVYEIAVAVLAFCALVITKYFFMTDKNTNGKKLVKKLSKQKNK